MKNRYWILLVMLTVFASCTNKFEEYNTDPKKPSVVPGESLFSNAEKNLSDQISSTNVNINIWKLMSQYWTETTYTDESNYNIVNRTIPDNIFLYYYAGGVSQDGFLGDFNRADSLIRTASAATDADKVIQKNKLAIIDLLEVYSYQRLVDIFGNVPYTEALNINNISPAYDDALTIYNDLFARVDMDIANLDDSQGSFGSADFYYNGDVDQWIKFAYSLKIKLGITLADVDDMVSGKAKKAVEDSYDKAFTSSDDNAEMPYLSNSPNYNSLYADLVASGRHDFVAANTIVDIMNNLGDPRRSEYFSNPINGTYVGGPYGEDNSYPSYSHVGAKLNDPTFPGLIMTYSEVQFYLAEAAARGWNVGKTAEEYYDAGITASIEWWGGSASDAADYLKNPAVDYTKAVASAGTGGWKEVIGTQSWLASYTRGLVGYTTWRRLDYPMLNMPPNPPTGVTSIPTRFTYPVNEQTLNANNYKAAADAIGGDELTIKLFWDKY